MITKKLVENLFKKWEAAGISCPAYSKASKSRMIQQFLEHFANMEEEALEYVGERLLCSPVWPTFSVIGEIAHEFREHNDKYVYIDYFADKTKNAYKEEEDFEAFIQRIAARYFPGREQSWIENHQLTLHYYGVCAYACEHCDGSCLHHGHQFYLRIKKGSQQPIPFASFDICSKYIQQQKKVQNPEEQDIPADFYEDVVPFAPNKREAEYIEGVLEGFE